MAAPEILISAELDREKLEKSIRGALQNIKAFEKPLGVISGKANEFTRSLDAAAARTTAFAAAAGALYALKSGFERLLGSMIEVEKSLTEINNLLNLGGGSLAKFSNDLFKVANDTSSSFANASKAAIEFSRQGLSVEETLKRTSAALTLTRLSSLPLENSIASLTAAMNSFGKESLDSIDIVNRLANVDAKFAVSSADLAEALKRVGSSASDANVSFNETIALITAAQQTTARGGSVIGNSFKTIFTRLQRPQVLDDLESAGIQVRNLNGESLSLIQVLGNLAQAYDGLSSAEKSFVAESVGGVYQINVLKSIIADLGGGMSVFSNAFNAASNSTAIGEERLRKLNETISSQLIRTLNNLTQAAANVGNLVFEPTIRGGLSTFDAIVKKISEATDPTNSDVLPNIFQGIGKGLAAALSGPGIQFAIFGLFKLFQRFASYVKDSFRDLTGLNIQMKQEVALQIQINELFRQQPQLINQVKSGLLSITQIQEIILNNEKQRYVQLQQNAAISSSVVGGGFAGRVARVSSSGVRNLAMTYSLVDKGAQEALRRENIATGGNAVLSQSSALITPNNPLGIVAIDKRTQKSGDDAVRQHLLAGQSLHSIKNAKTSNVPNLAIGNDIILSTFLGILQSINPSGLKSNLDGLKASFGSLFTFLDTNARKEDTWLNSKQKSIQSEREWVRVIEDSKSKILKGEKVSIPFEPGGRIKTPVSSLEQLDKAVGNKLISVQNDIEDFNTRRAERTQRIQRVGFATAIGASFAGGAANQFIGKFNPDLAKGSDEVFGGIQTAGQVLSVFQGNLAKAAGGFFVINGVLNGINAFGQGLEKQRKALEFQQNQSQKFSAAIDVVQASLSNLNGMVNDSSVSLDTLNREQLKLQNALAQIGSTPEGNQIVQEIQTAPTFEEKSRLLNRERELDNRRLGETTGLLQIAELASERTFSLFGKNLGAGLSGGIFGAGNEIDQKKTLSVVKGNAGNIFTSLTDELRNSLIESLEDPEKFQKKLLENDAARSIFKTITDKGGTDSDRRLQSEQVRLLINNFQANNSEGALNARKAGLEQNSNAQLNVDASIRKVNSLRRLALNSGAIRSENFLDLEKIKNQSFSNSSSINEAQRRAEAGRFAFLNGDKSVAAFELATETNKLNADRQFKVGNIRNETSRSLLGFFSQNIDSIAKPAGEKNINTASSLAISDSNEAILTALNKGLEVAVSSDLSKLFTENGGLDFQKLEDLIVGGSGGSDKISESLRKLISSDIGKKEIIDAVKGNNLQEISVNQDILKELQIHKTKFDAMIKELDTKRQANFLGGDKLFDRKFQREAQRGIASNTLLARNPRLSLEQRGKAASEVLKLTRELGRNPLEIAREENGRFIPKNGGRAAVETAQLLNLERAGLKQAQEKVAGGIGRQVGSGGFSSFIRDQFVNPVLAQARGQDNLAGRAVSAANRPESSQVIESATSGINQSILNTTFQFDFAANKVKNFGDTISNTIAKLENATKQLEADRKTQKEVSDSAQRRFDEAQKKALSKNAPNQQAQIDAEIVNSSNKTAFISSGIAALLTAAFFKKQIGSGLSKVGNLGGRAYNFALDAIDDTYNPKSLPQKLGKKRINLTPFLPQKTQTVQDILTNKRIAEIRKDSEQKRQIELIKGGNTIKGPLSLLPYPPAIKNFSSSTKEQLEFLKKEQRESISSKLFNPNIHKGSVTSLEFGQQFLSPTEKINRFSPINQTGAPFLYEGFKGANLGYGNHGGGTSPFGSKSISSSTFSGLSGGLSLINQAKATGGNISVTSSPRYIPLNASDAAKQKTPNQIKAESIQNALKKRQITRQSGFGSIEAFAKGGAFLGSTALGLGGAIGGSILGDKLIGDQYGIGASLGGILGTSLAGGLAAKSLGTLFAGGQGAGAALGASPLLGALAIGATAYGGFKGGNALYRGLNGGSFEGINEGTTNAYLNTSTLVQKQLRSGKSTEEIKKMIDAQISTTQSQIGIGGKLASAIGLGSETKNLEQAVEELKKLRASIDSQKDQNDAEKRAQETQAKLISALEKIASGGEGGEARISVEISLKDVDKLPEIFSNKILKPLEEQLKNLQNRTSLIENQAGISPQPASV